MINPPLKLISVLGTVEKFKSQIPEIVSTLSDILQCEVSDKWRNLRTKLSFLADEVKIKFYYIFDSLYIKLMQY